MIPVRCTSCGKQIKKNTVIVNISIGTLTEENTFKFQRKWGVMEKECFDKLMSDPQEFLQTLKESSKD